MAEGGSHTIELREWADELQNLLSNTGEVAAGPMEKESAPSSSSKKMYGLPLIRECSKEEEEEEFNHVYMPSKVGLGPRLTDRIFPNPKEASLAIVLRRSENFFFDELERYYKGLNSVVEELRGAYDNLDRRWQDYDRLQDDERYMHAISYPGAAGAFLRMMLLDGLFVLEVIDRNDDNPVIKRVLENDDDKKRCLHDILLLENQLPIALLPTLRTIQREKEINPNSIQEEREELVCDIIRTFVPLNRIEYYFAYSEITYFDSALNILDVYRRCLWFRRVKKEKRGLIWNIATPFKSRNRKLPTQIFINYNIFEYVPPATKLHEAGIRFQISPSTSLLDIQFSNKTLILPLIEVDSYTKSLFLNLIAFEKLHKHVAKNEVTSYMYFMGCLVHGPEDVALLQSQGIIVSRLPRVEVAAIFNRISKDISFDPDPDSELINTVIMVRGRYNKLSNEWRMELFQTYLKSPWAIISLLVAFLIFILSILQTLYSILSYIHRK